MSKKTIVLLALLAVAVFVFFRGRNNEVQEYGTAKIRIGDNVFIVEVADDNKKRAKGLSGRENLDENKGMLFLFNKKNLYGFWMKGMKFPIDLLWVKGNVVAGFDENLTPDDLPSRKIYYPKTPVDKVLEINAGEIEKSGVMIGDKIYISFL